MADDIIILHKLEGGKEVVTYDEDIRILCVDDERNVLKALQRVFLDDDYELLTASTGDEGLRILKETKPVQIVIADYRMPGMNGVEFLREVCQRWPETVRIVLSGYADTASIVEAINEGQIYKFIPKPWNDEDLRVTISNALERYFLQKKNIQLADELKKRNRELEALNNSLERLVRERTAELQFQNSVLERAQNILDSLPVGVIGIDSDGLIVQANRRAMEIISRDGVGLIGMESEMVLPKDLLSALGPERGSGQIYRELILNGRDVRCLGEMIRYPDGQEGTVLVFFPVESEKGVKNGG
jgi:two-component system NtrC family sensor kinase